VFPVEQILDGLNGAPAHQEAASPLWRAANAASRRTPKFSRLTEAAFSGRLQTDSVGGPRYGMERFGLRRVYLCSQFRRCLSPDSSEAVLLLRAGRLFGMPQFILHASVGQRCEPSLGQSFFLRRTHQIFVAFQLSSCLCVRLRTWNIHLPFAQDNSRDQFSIYGRRCQRPKRRMRHTYKRVGTDFGAWFQTAEQS
jgi:hypothetical protein